MFLDFGKFIVLIFGFEHFISLNYRILDHNQYHFPVCSIDVHTHLNIIIGIISWQHFPILFAPAMS